MEDAQGCGFEGVKHGHLQTEEVHGGEETRRYWITSDSDWLHGASSEWKNLKSIGMVKSTRKAGEKVSTERRFYLTSIPTDAKHFAQAVREHWGH